MDGLHAPLLEDEAQQLQQQQVHHSAAAPLLLSPNSHAVHLNPSDDDDEDEESTNPYARWTGDASLADKELAPQFCPLPPLSPEELAAARQHAAHHHSQTQQLLLVLLFAGTLSLLFLYGALRSVSLFSSDNLFQGTATPLVVRAKYFGLPALASLLLSMLVYYGYRAVWKKKTWRVLREASDGDGRRLRLRGLAKLVWKTIMSRPEENEPASAGTGGPGGRGAISEQSTHQLSFSASPPIPTASASSSAKSDQQQKGDGEVPSSVTSEYAFNHAVSMASTPGGFISATPGSYAFNHTISMASSPAGVGPMGGLNGQGAPGRFHSGGAGHRYGAPSLPVYPSTPSTLSSPTTTSDASLATPNSLPMQTLPMGAAQGEYGAVLAAAEANAAGLHRRSMLSLRNVSPYLPAHTDSGAVIDPFARAFHPPPAGHPYFYSAASLLHPSDIILLRQFPSWTHRLWSVIYSYWIFLFVPLFVFVLAAMIFQQAELNSFALAAFMAGVNMLCTQLVKLLSIVPSSCFGPRTMRSAFGQAFSLNVFVGTVAILNPLAVFCVHFVMISLGSVTSVTAAQEQANLQSLFSSVLQSYLLTVCGDELFLCARAWARWRWVRDQRDKEEERAARQERRRSMGEKEKEGGDGDVATSPSGAASSQSTRSSAASPASSSDSSKLDSFKHTVTASLMEYDLESEMKLYLYAVMFPIVLSSINPDIILVGACVTPLIYLGFKVRYEAFHALMNEPEEKVQLAGGTYAAAASSPLSSMRRGSDLLPLSSILSVLYLSTQWVITGGELVLMLLNLDQIFGAFLRPQSSASSSTGGGVPVPPDPLYPQATEPLSGTSSIEAILAATSTGLAYVTSSSTEASAAYPSTHPYLTSSFLSSMPRLSTLLTGSETAAIPLVQGAKERWQGSEFVGWGEGFHTLWQKSSMSRWVGSSSSSSSGSLSDDALSSTNDYIDAMLFWSLALLVLWVLRSWYFLCRHRVKAVRTAPYLTDEKHLPRSMRPTENQVGLVEDYIVGELNPDKLSQVAVSMSNRRGRSWLPVWWCCVHVNMFCSILLLSLCGVGLVYLQYLVCVSPCASDDLLCQSVCLDIDLLAFEVIFGFWLAPYVALLCYLPSMLCYAPVYFYLNEYFLGLPASDCAAWTQRSYPGKFGSQPCWIWFRRNRLLVAQSKRDKARQKELVETYGEREGTRQWEHEQKMKKEKQERAAGVLAAGLTPGLSSVHASPSTFY